jgi:hypothetical protein
VRAPRPGQQKRVLGMGLFACAPPGDGALGLWSCTLGSASLVHQDALGPGVGRSPWMGCASHVSSCAINSAPRPRTPCPFPSLFCFTTSALCHPASHPWLPHHLPAVHVCEGETHTETDRQTQVERVQIASPRPPMQELRFWFKLLSMLAVGNCFHLFRTGISYL